MSVAGEPSVVVDALWRSYRKRRRTGVRLGGGALHWALRDVSLTVPAGGSLGVIGANGSGKTTLLQVVAGVLGPSRGSVGVRGRVASLVDLSAGFHRDLTGHENLRIGGVLLGVSGDELASRYDDIVEFTGLTAQALDSPLSTYSAGMGLRLGFSLVVNSRPDVLLVDEVLAVGDEEFQHRCVEKVRELRDGGCAVMLVSHDMRLVRESCDDVAVLEDGELAYLAPARDAVEYYVERRSVVGVDDPGERPLYAGSWRVQAARRRRGVR